MNFHNFFTLTIRVQDYNLVAQNLELMAKLRALTLSYGSGMNHELNNFERISQERKVNCHILTAYRHEELVAWALLSREPSSFFFWNQEGFNPDTDGALFEVYVHPAYRRQGIATELLKVARRKADGYTLCVCPHDDPSEGFFNKFLDYNPKFI